MKLPTVAIDARLIGGSSTGDSTYWSGLVYGLSRLPARANILLLSNKDAPRNIPQVEHIRWIRAPGGNERWWSYVRFPLAARRLGASAIHTQYNLSPLVGRRGFTTVHDVSFFIGPEWFPAKDRLLLQTGVASAVRRARRVFTVSETSKAEVMRFLPAAAGKVVVTFPACPTWIEPVERSAAEGRIREELGVEVPFMLTVGTRWPRKNTLLAVKAAEMLDSTLPHRLVLTGKGGWGDQSVGRRGQPVGYVDEGLLSCLYSAADLYLAPSLHEGFGIPLLEAFRCGCPVLCSTGGSLPEVAADAAAVETSWEPAHWASSIQSLLQDSSKLDHLREAGRRREKEFSWEATASRTLDAYLGAMD